jgi:hypothetical protein
MRALPAGWVSRSENRISTLSEVFVHGPVVMGGIAWPWQIDIQDIRELAQGNRYGRNGDKSNHDGTT